MKIIIKEVGDNLGKNSENLDIVSRCTVYKDNNGARIVETCPRVTPTSNQINIKYHWFSQNFGKEIVVQK